jgi:hypothetical protein
LISNFLYRLRWKEGDSMVSRFIWVVWKLW